MQLHNTIQCRAYFEFSIQKNLKQFFFKENKFLENVFCNSAN